ncbi:leukocyte immunoglobulin-like receptor subfamily A member 6 isoform X2 [Artibeus jamaicensis]|uniref:leukocyte immunoglobulin-like receptor subfamily A member 6 isoform X2 n=1 Tax=Artibeus jamaicensis TaxID=9417 RepID=UPI00235B2152|nr:leukocyte immunoglobulin-like receptor subfamily A member 6 isoform X2 [Artibeus jamaicensis]
MSLILPTLLCLELILGQSIQAQKGAYKKPSLSSMSGTVVASGDKVTLKCFLKFKFDRFILVKEDEFHTIQNQSATCQDSQCQAIFNRGPVNSTQAGTYRCYGAFNDDPYVWSRPSDSLELEVKELPDGSTRPTDLGPTQASRAQDYTVGNLIRMGVAALVLVVLGVLLFQARDSERSVSNAARTCAQRGQGTVQNVGAVEPI